MKKRSLITRPLFFLLFSSSCLDAFQDVAPDFQIQVRIAVCIQDEYQSHHDDARRREDCLAGIRVEAENLGQRLPRPADERHQTVDHRRKRICDSQNINGEKFNIKPILKAEEIIEARKVVRQVYLDEKIERYIVDIVFATRFPEKYDLKELKDMIGFGGSPRASINLALAARTYAFIKRRGYVIPEDVRAVAHDVLRHRIGLTYEAEANSMTSDEIISKILNKVEVP